MSVQILTGDCLDRLSALPDESVHCCVTSPPYYGLRSYFEDAIRINPALDENTKSWLAKELNKRGIHAKT